MNHGHIKLPPTKLLSDSCIERRKLNDSDWINYIFFGLLKYIKVVDKQSILRIINNPKIKKYYFDIFLLYAIIRLWKKY